MNLKEKVKALCKERGVSVNKFEKDIGIANGSVKNWDVTVPSGDKIMATAKYFNVKPTYLMTDDESAPEYYIDPVVATIAQEIADNPDLKVLFDASKKMKKEDLEFVIDMIERMK